MFVIVFVFALALALEIVRNLSPGRPIQLGEGRTMPPSKLYHERLDAYQLSIRFVALAARISANMPRGHAGLADQLRRAAISIPLNIAEGVGKPRPADRARFHAIARGSAMECSAIIDVVGVLHENPEALQPAKELLVRIVEMLTKMCR